MKYQNRIVDESYQNLRRDDSERKEVVTWNHKSTMAAPLITKGFKCVMPKSPGDLMACWNNMGRNMGQK